MRKGVLVLVSILALVGGCCTRTNVNGVTTKSFTNCLTTAQQMLCNPTDAEKASALAIENFLTSGAVVVGAIAGIPITPAAAQAVFVTIASGACVVATDLQNALAWYNALTSGVTATKGLKAVPNPGALFELLAKGQ